MTHGGLNCRDEEDRVWTRTNKSERVLDGAVGKKRLSLEGAWGRKDKSSSLTIDDTVVETKQKMEMQ